uniref:Uncharacterized protein n=1 Tax=Entomoneis paludosa TaxID=265537 RepID=A0A7S2YNU1_9STRA|mmetsp:Transcript_40241/g.83820  ORF Transcript_40241/g.83820 Transcript_40241/m.83820 type:complete len:266 (+) Transcript_40241:56-853(+)
MGPLSFAKAWVTDDGATELLNESVWIFLFSRHPLALTLAVGTVVLQWMILRAFTIHTELQVFSVACDSAGFPVCEGWEMSFGTCVISFIILLGWTVSDMMKGLHLALASCLFPNNFERRFRFLFVACCAGGVGVGTLITSYVHILEAATSDLDALMNVVGILYVMDIDEAIFASLAKLAPHWHQRLLKEIAEEYSSLKNGGPDGSSGSDDTATPKQESAVIRMKSSVQTEPQESTMPSAAANQPRSNDTSPLQKKAEGMGESLAI